MSRYDVVIIGGGPIGMACGIAAKKAGIKLCDYRKGRIGKQLI